jgi:hypothetical protein
MNNHSVYIQFYEREKKRKQIVCIFFFYGDLPLRHGAAFSEYAVGEEKNISSATTNKHCTMTFKNIVLNGVHEKNKIKFWH